MHKNTEENMNRFKCIKNNEKNLVLKAMKEKAEEMLTEFKIFHIVMFRLVKVFKNNIKCIERGRCMRGSN